MRHLIIVLAVVALAGCATSHKIKVIRGQTGLQIECSGMTSGWDRCYKRAARECKPGGYKVIGKSDDIKEDPDDYPFGLNPAGLFTRRMVAVCI